MINPRRPDAWYQRSVLYQIYPLSFADSTGDGFGDLRGIINHLDYLNDGTAESLGVGAIWLTPIYASPMADWGYDITNHCAIDPKFGSLADFDELVAKAHGRGMKVLLDFVPNHTSSQHPWFKQARASRNNPKRDWYVWANAKQNNQVPNNWLSHFGGPAWTWDETTSQYYLHSFLPEQPDVNWRNPEVRAAMLDILRFWLSRGVDGFRADAMANLAKDPELRDDPLNPKYHAGKDKPSTVQLRVNSANHSGVGEALGAVCQVLDDGADTRFVLSEISDVYLSVPDLQQYYAACQAHPVHAPFNFNLMGLVWDAAVFRSFIDEYEAGLGPEDWPNYVLGNHDKSRLVTRVGAAKARLLAMLQLTLRGLPVIYYGDELGLQDAVVGPNQVRDPLERHLPGFGRDGERAPMPWADGLTGGFTTGQPWLPLPPHIGEVNVAAQERNPQSFLQLYRHLIALRSTCLPFIQGDYRSLDVGNVAVLAYVRETAQGRCYVVLNFSDQPQAATLRRIGRWVAGTHLVEGDGEPHTGDKLHLEPHEGRVYELRKGEQ